MNLFVVFLTSALVLYVVLYRIFISMAAYGAGEIPFRQEFSSPQLLLHSWDSLEYLPGRYAFHYSHYPRWAVPRNWLEQKMNMVFLNPNLNEDNFVPPPKLQTHILENRVHIFRKKFARIRQGTPNDTAVQTRYAAYGYIRSHQHANTIQKAEAIFGELTPKGLDRCAVTEIGT